MLSVGLLALYYREFFYITYDEVSFAEARFALCFIESAVFW